jgi:hypothetical protein
MPQDKINGPSDGNAKPYQSPKGDDGFGFRRSDQPASKDEGVSQIPRSFTLHLDGASLGRWTVDHLQRTLSKPASGMTGVDPRAVVPRSRVSPF